MDASSCKDLESAIAEYALGERSELGQEELTLVEAHLAACPDCRTVLKDFKAVGSSFQKLADIEVPDEMMKRGYDRITVTVQNKEEEYLAVAKARAKAIWLCWLSGVAASIVILATGYLLIYSKAEDRPNLDPYLMPVTQNQIGQPTSATLERRFVRLDNASEALKLLNEEFQTTKARFKPENMDFKRIQVLAKKLIERWGKSQEALDSLLLVSRCYTEMTESDKARKAFLAYADAVGQRAELRALAASAHGEEARERHATATSATLYAEACRLFRQKDYFAALAYSDTLLTRYPETKLASKAQYIIGNYHECINAPDEAISAYREVVERSEDKALLLRTYESMSRLLFNSGAKDDAARVMEEMAKRFPTEDEGIYALFHTGLLQYARGPKYFPGAVSRFHRIIEKHPDHKYARSSKNMIALINRKMLDTIITF